MTGLIVVAVVAAVVTLLFTPEILTLVKRRGRRSARRRDRDGFD